MTIIQAEVDRHARAKLADAKKRLVAKREFELTGKQIAEHQEGEEGQRPITLDEILVNEGLIKFEVPKSKRLWKVGLNKIQTLIKERHFSDQIIIVDLKGFQFSLVDNSL